MLGGDLALGFGQEGMTGAPEGCGWYWLPSWFVPDNLKGLLNTALVINTCASVSDKNVPSELEYMVISFKEPHMYLRQWNNSSVCQEIQFSAQADCKLLECRNVTMQSLVKPFSIFGQTAISSNAVEKLIDCSITIDSIFVNFGQHVVHSLNTAVQAWQQVCTF